MLAKFAGIFRELSANFPLTSRSIQAASRDRYQFRRTLHAPRCSLFSARSCARPQAAALRDSLSWSAPRPPSAAVRARPARSARASLAYMDCLFRAFITPGGKVIFQSTNQPSQFSNQLSLQTSQIVFRNSADLRYLQHPTSLPRVKETFLRHTSAPGAPRLGSAGQPLKHFVRPHKFDP